MVGGRSLEGLVSSQPVAIGFQRFNHSLVHGVGPLQSVGSSPHPGAPLFFQPASILVRAQDMTNLMQSHRVSDIRFNGADVDVPNLAESSAPATVGSNRDVIGSTKVFYVLSVLSVQRCTR